jgi:hypothetical protein
MLLIATAITANRLGIKSYVPGALCPAAFQLSPAARELQAVLLYISLRAPASQPASTKPTSSRSFPRMAPARARVFLVLVAAIIAGNKAVSSELGQIIS